MGAGKKGIDVSPGVSLEQLFLQRPMEKFKTFRSPKTSGYGRLIGHHTNEVALAT
jgi:hypothetical protein